MNLLSCPFDIFSMNYLGFAFFICLFNHSVSFGQEWDTIYYDVDWNETTYSNQLAFYRIYSKESVEGVYPVRDYYMSGILQMKGQYADASHEIMTGKFIWYYSNGNKAQESSFIDNKYHGDYIEWYENGQKSAHERFDMDKEVDSTMYWYENGQLSDLYIYNTTNNIDSVYSWYENGKKCDIGTVVDLPQQYVKVDQLWDEEGVQLIKDGKGIQAVYFDEYYIEGPIKNGLMNGTWTKYNYDDEVEGKLKFKDGSFVQGYLFNNGQKDKFDTWEREPEFSSGGIDGFSSYIEKNLAYDCEDEIKNKVYVKFIVNRDGTISSFNITAGEVSDCQYENLKDLFRDMPKWKPGIQAANYVSVSFTLPIDYKNY